MSVSIPQTTAAQEARWTLTMRQRQKLHTVFFLYVPLAFFMLFALFPFLWMGISSITIEEELYDADRLPWVITEYTFDHY
ncbi:MAG: carbohydrate ABC transporter permease, partial [bacterium]